MIRLLLTLIFVAIIGFVLFRFVGGLDIHLPGLHEWSIEGVSFWVQNIISQFDIGMIISGITGFFANNLGLVGAALGVGSIFILVEESL